MPGLSLGDAFLPSENGSEVYVFNSSGRHLRTLDALTGAVRYQFTYDGAGRLTQVTDGDGNVTTLERNLAGDPTAIVAPGGQRTALEVNADGYLSRITDPTGNAVGLTYYPATGPADERAGLLATETDPRGGVQRFRYATTGSHPNDPLSWGRLVGEEDAADGVTTLTRSPTPNGHKVLIGREDRLRYFQMVQHWRLPRRLPRQPRRPPWRWPLPWWLPSPSCLFWERFWRAIHRFLRPFRRRRTQTRRHCRRHRTRAPRPNPPRPIIPRSPSLATPGTQRSRGRHGCLERLTNPCAVAEFASIQAGPAIPECWRIQLPQTES